MREAGRGIVLATSEEVWPIFWGCDNALYGLTGETVRQLWPARIGAPCAPLLVAVRSRERPTVVLGRVDWTRGVHVTVPPLGQAILYGAFSDGRRFLVTQLGLKSHAVVVDASGRVLASLDGAALDPTTGKQLANFTPKSATADMGYVAGFYEVDRDMDVVRAAVALTDTTGRRHWIVDGAPDAVDVQCSPHGPWMALGKLHGGVAVGVLNVNPGDATH
jgi:hypothetical protein